MKRIYDPVSIGKNSMIFILSLFIGGLFLTTYEVNAEDANRSSAKTQGIGDNFLVLQKQYDLCQEQYKEAQSKMEKATATLKDVAKELGVEGEISTEKAEVTRSLTTPNFFADARYREAKRSTVWTPGSGINLPGMMIDWISRAELRSFSYFRLSLAVRVLSFS